MGENNLFIEQKIRTLNLIHPIADAPIQDDFCNSAEYWYELHTSSSVGKEDQKQLQQARLKHVLDQLQAEREDLSFSRSCLFCSKHFTGNRTVLLEHLKDQHNFVIGAPDNIVFVKEYLDHLEMMLKNLQCFYCEKVFRDLAILKEHMRKKQHRRVNPQNKFYDKFYVINYLELGKTWVEIQKEDDGHYQDENEKEMMDWEDDKNVFTCLFCENKLGDFDETLQHMKVCICDIKETDKGPISDLQKDYKENVIYLKCDVTSFNDFKNSFEKTLQLFGRIDIVINNAGIVNEQEWQKMIEINLVGVIHGIQLGFQYLSKESGHSGGFIFNTISNTGFEAFPISPIYAGTKHALVGLTRSYGAEYHFHKTGVKVCGIAPGPTDTELMRTFHLKCLDEAAGREQVASVTPVTPDDIAKGLLKLLEDDKNGAILRVDCTGMYYA